MPRLNNPRQEAVAQLKAEAYLNPTNATSDTQIIKKVYGYSQESAAANSTQIMKSNGVQTRLVELLNARVPDDKLALKTKQLLDCKKVIRDKNGKVIGKDPDNANQVAVLNLVLKAKGLMSDINNTFIDARQSTQYNLALSQSNVFEGILDRFEKINNKLNQNVDELAA